MATRTNLFDRPNNLCYWVKMTVAEISDKLQEGQTVLPTLGGRKSFTVVKHGGNVSIRNSGDNTLQLNDAHVAAVFERYLDLPAPRHLKAGNYVDPNWGEVPNRIFSPYVAKLIDHILKT